MIQKISLFSALVSTIFAYQPSSDLKSYSSQNKSISHKKTCGLESSTYNTMAPDSFRPPVSFRERTVEIPINYHIIYVEGDSIFINVTVDDQPYDHASWDIRDYDNNTFLFYPGFGFETSGHSYSIGGVLPPGNYGLLLWDDFATGGISASVTTSTGEVLASIGMGQWGQYTFLDFTTPEGDFVNGMVSNETIAEQTEVLNNAYNGFGYSFSVGSIDSAVNAGWYYATDSHKFETGQWENDDQFLAMTEVMTVDVPTSINFFWTGASMTAGLGVHPWSFPEDDPHHGLYCANYTIPGGTEPFTEGYTGVHEVGHYLGLYHTFENGCDNPGDEVDDTPYQEEANTGCPTNPHSCNSYDDVGNYMDYMDDICMSHFTEGQQVRIQWAIETYRPALLENINNEGVAWHVSTDGSDETGDGSEGNPFATIQHGINTSENGDTVFVAPGHYWENINYTGKNIVVGSHFLTTENEDYISQTTIFGGGFYVNAPTVLMENGENNSAILTGFTISSGSQSGVRVIDSSPTLTHLKITENNGGIHLINSNSLLEHLFINENSKDDMHHGGAGIFAENSSITVNNSVITNNWSGWGGWITDPAGIDVYSSELVIERVSMYGNSGGSIGLGQSSSCTILNSIIWNYLHDDDPYTNLNEILVSADCELIIAYTDVYGGVEGVWEGGTVNWLEGNLNEYPLFCEPHNEDFTLAMNSPCVGTGENGANMGALDIGCSPINYNVAHNPSWNMVGIPFEMDDSQYQSIFPDAVIGTLYSFNGSYQQEEHLEPSIGYLIRLDNGGEYPLAGNPLFEVVVFLSEGWNVISGPAVEVSANDVYENTDYPDVVVPGTIYGFDGAYFSADVLEPGKGYWVRSTGSAAIMLPQPENRNKTVHQNEITENLNSLVVINHEYSRTLYFGEKIREENELSYSLPPTFEGMKFDVRFSGDTKLCTTDDCSIELIVDEQPLVVECEIIDGEFWEIVDESGNVFECSGVNGFELSGESETFILRKSTSQQNPTAFTLFPAYPNPFNPVTNIQFSVPEKNDVNISIYDVQGRLIETLLDKNLNPGNHSVQWNANGVTSGVYFVSFEEGGQREIQKVVLMK